MHMNHYFSILERFQNSKNVVIPILDYLGDIVINSIKVCTLEWVHEIDPCHSSRCLEERTNKYDLN